MDRWESRVKTGKMVIFPGELRENYSNFALESLNFPVYTCLTKMTQLAHLLCNISEEIVENPVLLTLFPNFPKFASLPNFGKILNYISTPFLLIRLLLIIIVIVSTKKYDTNTSLSFSSDTSL